MTTPDEIAAVMTAATTGEQRRREVAATRPGHGTEVPLEQSPAGPSVGKAGLDLPAVGLGYETPPEPSESVHAAYSMPRYADSSVAGIGFQAGRQEAPIRVLVGTRSAPADGVVFASAAPARPSLWSRLFGRGRR